MINFFFIIILSFCFKYSISNEINPIVIEQNCKSCHGKNYSGNKNLEGYRSAYICTLKKINETIDFLKKFDPNSTVVFQSDHNWSMSKNDYKK